MRYPRMAAGNQQTDPVGQRLHRGAVSQMGMLYGRMGQRGFLMPGVLIWTADFYGSRMPGIFMKDFAGLSPAM